MSKSYPLDLQQAFDALSATDGNVSKAADMLCVPVHRLHSCINENAELQAIVKNRLYKTQDLAMDYIMQAIDPENVLVDINTKLATSRWFMERTHTDFNPKNKVELEKGPGLKERTEEELETLLSQLDPAALEAYRAIKKPKVDNGASG